MFVFITSHLHINGKSACWFLGGDRMCFAGGWGGIASGNGDEQTLQGRIISYYPQFPNAALRRWARLDSSHGQKRVESLTRFIRPSQTPSPPRLLLLLLPCLPASRHPSVSSAACCLPYVLNSFPYFLPTCLETNQNVILSKTFLILYWNEESK